MGNEALYLVSWLVRSSPDRTVRVWALAGDIVLCSWAGHFTFAVPLSTQVYKWEPANLMLGGYPCDGLESNPGGVKILSVASCYWNRDKLRPDEPLDSYTDLTFYPCLVLICFLCCLAPFSPVSRLRWPAHCLAKVKQLQQYDTQNKCYRASGWSKWRLVLKLIIVDWFVYTLLASWYNRSSNKWN